MEFSEASQNINNEPKVINVPLTDGMLRNSKNEDIIFQIKEEPELQICDEIEHQEIIDLTDEHVTTTTVNQSGCKNCPKIVTATGKIQQIHYCYTAEDKKKKKLKTIVKSNNNKLKTIVKSNNSNKCNLCDKEFKFKSELFVHKKRVHTFRPSYKCIKCKRTLFSVNSYKQHVLHAHTDDTKIQNKTIKMKGVNSEGKPYNYDIMVYL